jgi:hypothetical protein
VCSRSTEPCRPKRNTQPPDRFDPEHIPAARRTPTFADCPCRVCEVIDDVEGVVCDRCDKVTHLHCLSPPRLTQPKGSWCCPGCALRECRSKPCSVRREAGDDAGPVAGGSGLSTKDMWG